MIMTTINNSFIINNILVIHTSTNLNSLKIRNKNKIKKGEKNALIYSSPLKQIHPAGI